MSSNIASFCALGISTSGPVASVALLKNSAVYVQANATPRSHAEFLHQAIQQLCDTHTLNLKNVDELAIDLGPGSFTGVRIAVSFAKAFSYLKGDPIWTCSALEVPEISKSVGPLHSTDFILTAIDGFNGIFYHWFRPASFAAAPKAAQDFGTSSLEEICNLVLSHPQFQKNSVIHLLGNAGTEALATALAKYGVSVMKHAETQTSAEVLLEHLQKKSKIMKKTSWKEIFPLYLRASAAEEKEG